MSPTIRVYSRLVYGQPKVYVLDPVQADALSTLTNGARTLESRHLRALEALGFTIEQVPDPRLTKV